jgi:uncharacterized protein (TIGR02145 family)
MKIRIRIVQVIAIVSGLLLVVGTGCKKAEVPELTTSDISGITQTTASCGGTITSDGGADITERGICWKAGSVPEVTDNKTVDGTGEGSFTSSISGLSPNVMYFVRAYATNKAGTGYGQTVSFSSLYALITFNPNLTYGTVTDYDGNVYKTITIGTQTWMAENLKTTHYRNGDAIPNVTNGATWQSLTTGAWCDYKNMPGTSSVFGKLYNFYAVTDARNIAPTGWHVPTDAEWNTMVTYLGSAPADKLKETGNNHWFLYNTTATNSSGFSAIAGGSHDWLSYNILLGQAGFWWTCTEYDASTADFWAMYDDDDAVNNDILDKTYGYSIRCVQD